MKLARPRHRLRSIPFNSLIPNMITVLAFCAGLTAVRLALQEKWELAVFAILAAAILDGLDGRMARLLKGTSKFGAELDSLSDFVAFGVAPALVMYLWSTHDLGGLGWIASLAFATCCGLRLARFNTTLEDAEQPAWMAQFFTGVAAPIGGLFALYPLVLAQLFETQVFASAPFVACWLVIWAFFMISRIPTFSFKRVRIGREYVLPILLAAGLSAAIIVSYPWFALTVMGIAYIVLMPLSYRAYRRYLSQDRSQEVAQTDTISDSNNSTAQGAEKDRE